MYAKEVTINNPTGLHARPATQLVREAEKYQDDGGRDTHCGYYVRG